MNQIITADRIQFGIGKKGEGVAGLLTKVARFFGAIDADCDWTDSDCIELIKVFLNAPQLGVA